MTAAAPSLFDAPATAGAFFLTNRFNLLEILSSRMIKSRAGHADERYFVDLLDRAPGRVPLIADPPSPPLCEYVSSGGESAFPVLLELDPSALGRQEVAMLGRDGSDGRASIGSAGAAPSGLC